MFNEALVQSYPELAEYLADPQSLGPLETEVTTDLPARANGGAEPNGIHG